MRIAVCDDNEIQRDITLQTVREYLFELDDGSTIDTYSSGRELVAAVEQGGAYDVYIMDIIMPDFDGIETSKELRSMSPTGEIVFLTNSNEYAADSYGVGALYYLLKPIDKRKLYNVLQRAADPDIIRRCKTAVGFLRQKDHILCQMGCKLLHRIVGGSIVQQNDLKILERLLFEAVQTLEGILPAVIV